jgi:predicted CoA-binding protein
VKEKSMLEKEHRVAVLGASDKPERYAYKAVKMLTEYGYSPIPVRPGLDQVMGIPVSPSLSDIKEKVHTLSVYIGPGRIGPLIDDIVKLNPERVILNPGTESNELMQALDKAGIFYEEACTLVLLRTEQF